MVDANRDNNVFRFSHLRPARAETSEPGPILDAAPRPEGDARRPPKGAYGTPPAPPAYPSPPPPSPAPPRERPPNEVLVSVKRELERLDLAQDLNLPGQDDKTSAAIPFTLKSESQARLSDEARTVLQQLGAPAASTPFPRILDLLDAELAVAVRPPRGGGVLTGPPPEPAQLRSVGVAELLLVKQQIKRYEAGEIAHIENILAGESKVRIHRQLNRIEEFLSSVSEREHEKESELQTTERFELNRETSRTMQVDQQTGFGLTLSGKYGPTVEFSSNFQITGSTSETSAQKNAVTYAKEIVERSKERIVERARQERRLTILREVEETNEHRLTNEDSEHRAGVYQFVDKIYESQVFNYGLRQMFDFMVPEPASYLWHLETLPQPDVDLPVPPLRLELEAPNASYIDEGNYLRLGARYGAKSLKTPPPTLLLKSQSVTQGQGSESEGGQPRSRSELAIDIPDGYRPLWAFITVMGTTDEDPTISISLAQQNRIWRPSGAERVGLAQGSFILFQTDGLIEVFPYDSGAASRGDKIHMHVFANETASYSVHVKVMFQCRSEATRGWQIATYDAIAEAYANVLMQYQQDVEALKQREEAKKVYEFETGNPPSVNERIVRAELKKHCLAFIRNEHLGQLSTVHTPGDATTPPQFDLADAREDGPQIRFFEHAFEWDQLQYVFYPYFWARPGGWADRFHARNMDPVLEEFLKAGYARVVVPVRPGFEAAVSFYLTTREVWDGEGEPDIDDPLYKPILEEIKERTGADQGEIAVGDPWETRLPTTAILVRRETSLPAWQRTAPGAWTWEPV